MFDFPAQSTFARITETHLSTTMDEKLTSDRELYAIFVPNSPQPTVFRELKEVRKFLDSPLGKKEGTRFKKCSDEDELKSFIAAETKKEEESPKQSAAPSTSTEPSSPYRSLPTARFTEFRRAIEQRNDEKFDALIKESPRFFLNTNTDSPAIVQEGYRFNTLHIACRTSNVTVVKRCFELARDLEWLTHVYGTDRCVEERSEFLVNSLLNTPDLIENNTPLHYACKFGQPEIVRFLLTFPTLKRYPKNKYNEKPMDMLCRSFKGSPEDKERLAAEITTIFRRGLSPARRTPSRAIGAGGDATQSSPLSHLAGTKAAIGELPSTPRSSAGNVGGVRLALVDVKIKATSSGPGSAAVHAKRIVGALLSAAASAIRTTPKSSPTAAKDASKADQATPQSPRSPMAREVSMMADELRDKLLLYTPPPAPTPTPVSTSDVDEDSEEDDDEDYHDASDLPLRRLDDMEDEGEHDETASETNVDDETAEKKGQPNQSTQSMELPQQYCTIL